MKLKELNYDEMMNTNGGYWNNGYGSGSLLNGGGTIRDGQVVRDGGSSSSSSSDKCERDWGQIGRGVFTSVAGGLGYAFAIDDDGTNKIEYIRESSLETMKSGVRDIREGWQCRDRGHKRKR